MTQTQTADKARQRLVVLVEHLIAHTKDHANELASARSGLADHIAAARLLDAAVTDLSRAHRSLGAFLECLTLSD